MVGIRKVDAPKNTSTSTAPAPAQEPLSPSEQTAVLAKVFAESTVQSGGIPALADAGIRLFFCGPESFTPDGLYHLGEVAGLRNYLVAAGFNSVGMLSGPGAGAVLADWLVDGRPSIDLPEVDPRRTMPHETNRRFLEQRVTETLDVSYSDRKSTRLNRV